MDVGEPSTILILDDSEVLLAAAQYRLQADGFEVLTALDLDQFRGHLSQREPDLVVLDVQMHDDPTSGVADLLEELRGKSVPVLLFSGLDEVTLAEHAARAGVQGYVCKSEGLDGLIQRARELLAGSS